MKCCYSLVQLLSLQLQEDFDVLVAVNLWDEMDDLPLHAVHPATVYEGRTGKTQALIERSDKHLKRSQSGANPSVCV